jgi:hypothetical protein
MVLVIESILIATAPADIIARGDSRASTRHQRTVRRTHEL